MASLAKWLSVRLRSKWLWVRVPLRSPNALYDGKKFDYLTITNNICLTSLITNNIDFLITSENFWLCNFVLFNVTLTVSS